MIDRQARAEIDELRQDLIALDFTLRYITTTVLSGSDRGTIESVLRGLAIASKGAYAPDPAKAPAWTPKQKAAAAGAKRRIDSFIEAQREFLLPRCKPQELPVINSAAPAYLDTLPPGFYVVNV